MKFFKDEFFSSSKYDDFIEYLYIEDIFDESDIEKVIGNEDTEKDDFEFPKIIVNETIDNISIKLIIRDINEIY